jgi:hypothetical protein
MQRFVRVRARRVIAGDRCAAIGDTIAKGVA